VTAFHSARTRHTLTARLSRRFALVTQAIRIGPLDFTFTRVARPEKVLDDVIDQEARRQRAGVASTGEVHIPYWAELWESASGLGEFLTSHPDWVRGKAVLDLGCGMGLSGAVAHRLGGRVMQADIDPSALLFARLNALPPDLHADSDTSANPADTGSLPIRTRRVNWQVDDLHEKFDVILGADIVYERSQWPHLAQFWQTHLTNQGFILLGEPGRATGDDFVVWIAQAGWKVERIEERKVTDGKVITVLKITRDSLSGP